MLQNGSWYSAEYDTFHLESESQYYRIHVGGYSGDLCDVMNLATHVHNGMNFTTYDRDNDVWNYSNCAVHEREGEGGWWYRACFYFNLNGHYGKESFSVYYSGRYTRLSASRMMLKKK